MSRPHSGIIAALAAFFLWGVLPIYWMWLSNSALLEIICHRTVWAAVVLWLILLCLGQFRTTLSHLRSMKIVAWHLLSGLLLAGNWGLYIWATCNERILEGALGYYLNPFFNMLFGYLLFQEQHSRLQKMSIAIALAGVAIQFHGVHHIPWVALTLALSFSLYGVVRKKSPLPSLPGLALETLLLLPIALVLLMFLYNVSSSTGPIIFDWRLVTTGVATATPLLLFGYAARKITLSTLGVLQFLGPTLQFLIGWLIYNEALSPMRVVSFALIWFAVLLYIMAATRTATIAADHP